MPSRGRIRAIAHLLLPPIVLDVARALRLAPGSQWEYVGPDWPQHDPRAEGWAHPSVAAALTERWTAYARIVKGTGALGHWPLAPDARDEAAHNLMMTFGYVLARAAHGRRTLSILDWGGSIGHYALAAERLLPEVSFDYTIKELPGLCDAIGPLLPKICVTSSDKTAFSRRYDLVVASNSIQYARDWRELTRRLAEAAGEWIFLTCIPTVRKSRSFVVVQRPYAYGLKTEYISWVFDRSELLEHLTKLGLVLTREFLAGGTIEPRNAPEPPQLEGFLLRWNRASS